MKILKKTFKNNVNTIYKKLQPMKKDLKNNDITIEIKSKNYKIIYIVLDNTRHL